MLQLNCGSLTAAPRALLNHSPVPPRSPRCPACTQIATSLTALTELRLVNCSSITFAAARNFPQLRVLHIAHCNNVSSTHLGAALPTCEQLEELSLEGGAQVTSLSLTLPHLRRCTLQGLRGLTDLSLTCRWGKEQGAGGSSVLGGAKGRCARLARMHLWVGMTPRHAHSP